MKDTSMPVYTLQFSGTELITADNEEDAKDTLIADFIDLGNKITIESIEEVR